MNPIRLNKRQLGAGFIAQTLDIDHDDLRLSDLRAQARHPRIGIAPHLRGG